MFEDREPIYLTPPRAPGHTVGTRATRPTSAVAVLGLTSRAAIPAGPQQIAAGLRWASRDFTRPRHPARPPDLMTLPGHCDPTDDLQHPDHQSQSY